MTTRKSYVNRWGEVLKLGQSVRAVHAQNLASFSEIKAFDKTSEFAKAYGIRVTLANGFSAGLDDCHPITLKPLNSNSK